ncbi:MULTISPECIES: lipase family protein [unclassified Crossiella]|uniref:lipase family protein n=1 Tax=unclassified Crossiella TaxID=2620835 RepID=UPI001FFFDE0A|nr:MULTISPECIES: lipase family protein [unclassified Crossiella]MCK2243741.1 lipase family protein [Crossiella sp. S99.2]MCK2257600.1 lipase family protein [Crossiella sp. S99.1]
MIATLALAALAPGAASAAGLVPPPPAQDPFYAVPANIGGLANGTVLDSRPIVATALSVPIAAHAWQVKYKTIDQRDQPSAFVTTILVPYAPWHGGGARPVLSYQTAEDAVGSQCAPSYALRAGLAAGVANGAETPIIAEAVARGFTVAVPDYEGPRSDFLGAHGAAHGVLDGIRAARNFAPAGISAGAPIGLMGYSGGSMATDWAIQAQPTYAPDLTLAGAASGGTVADTKTTMLHFSGKVYGGALAVIFAGLDRSYPRNDVLRYLNATGQRAVAASQSACLLDAVARYPFVSVQRWGAHPDILADPGLTAAFAEASLLDSPGTPTTPVLFYHSLLDELAPIGAMRQLAARYCAKGVTVHTVESFAGEHAGYAVTGAPTALDYLADRFAGKPAPNDC